MKTYIYHTDTLGADTSNLSKIAKIIVAGGLVAIPTETVYGLGANALDEDAVAKIYMAKGRPQDNPTLIHIPDSSWLTRYCQNVAPEVFRLTEQFWPGPLTLVLERAPCIPDRATSGLPTVGVRCADNAITNALIQLAGVPIAAPSANLSGRPSCTSAQMVLEDFDGLIDAVIDDGPCRIGVESTILDMTCTPPRLLRPGGLPLEQLQSVLGEVSVDAAVYRSLKAGEAPKAPGMKYRHYAPKAPLTAVIGDAARSATYIQSVLQPEDGVICYEEYRPLFAGHCVQSLGSQANPKEHAQSVFGALRAFDKTDITHIWAQCPDGKGIDLAVSNRIKKAAGFDVTEV